LLNPIPFEVLETSKSNNDFLIKHHSVRYVYSSKQLVEKSKLKANSMVFGMAPFTNQYAKKTVYRHLPDSEVQIKGVSNEYLIGKEATKQNFLKYYQDFGTIYLATHSVMNDKYPNQSAILFSTDSDDKLTTEEIYNLKLKNTKLVVLSSCDAGNGLLHQSEGQLSITRAFSYAGCPAVISTLWATQDASTSHLVKLLHHHLEQGLEKDLALQKAKIDFMDSDVGKKFNHPFFWSNLILVGNSEPLFAYNYRRILWIMIGVLLIGLIFFVYKKLGV
jgi:CHAT domain-containing protein